MPEVKKRDLTTGPIWKAVTVMSAPMSVGIFSVIAVGVADAYFLGQVSGAALAAVGFIYPVITAVTSLSIGLSAGANATLSQAVGAQETDEHVRRLGIHSIGLGLLLSLVVALVLWVSYPALFSLLGAKDDVAAEIAKYMPLWIVSFPFLVVMMITNSVFRAHGDGTTAAAMMVLAALFGILLNPVFIFGWWIFPELGTQGAALSTLVGRVVAMALALYLAVRWGMIGVCGKPLKDIIGSVKSVINVGAPASFSNAVNPAGMAMVTAAVAQVGDAAVAGFGAATRVQSLALVPLMALSAGIGPVVGQNWGAEEYDRAKGGVRFAFAVCVAYGLALGIIVVFFAEPIAGLLAASDDDLRYATQYLQIVGLSMFGYGVIVVANAAMNARNKALWSMSLSVGRIFLVYLPGAWLGLWMFGFYGILIAAVVANVAGAAAAAYAARATKLS